jgi:outer membrane protein OmpA-like peptidoglycan-associated protein
MPELDAARPAESGTGAAEFTELRHLLIGPELEELARVQDRLTDPAKRAEDFAQVLPEAIRAARGKALREALEPVFEKAFHSTVRKNPREIADAIYPIIGPAIRTSIAAAIRDFAEALNQIVEKSVSFRSIRWRIEALLTGKPFSQILLSKSLLYSVEQVFLIHRKSGLLLQHAAAEGAVVKDADMVSGMLTAIQDFLADSFADGGQDLETVDAGRFKLWLSYGPKVLLVGAVSGTAPVELKQVFRQALDQIEESLQSEIANFKQDDLTAFERARPSLGACLLGRPAAAQRRTARLWPWLAGIALIIVVIAGYEIRQRMRWNEYLASLKQRPGIVVTAVEREGSSYVIEGLKDPLASEPSGSPGRAVFHLRPYLSLDTPFAEQRELASAKELIERRLIRFDPGSSKLGIEAAGAIDDLTPVIARLLRARPNTRIIVTGRADETGSPETNDTLSLDRAASVIDALVAQGLAPEALAKLAAGNTQPLRQGSTEWDRATNRSVSFRIAPGN